MPTQPAESTPDPKKQNRRPSSARKQVYLTWEAHKLLVPAAEELGITASEYASAAVTYFAQRGLDPVKNQEREGIIIQNRITELEKIVSNLGNRLFGWLTQHEKNLDDNLFGFLRGHEKTLSDYLQALDKNIHDHLTDQEDSVLMPLMREMIATNVEALYSRRLGEQLMLRAMQQDQLSPERMKQFNADYAGRHRTFNEKRDEEVSKRFGDFVENLMPAPQELAIRLQPTPLPQRAKKRTDAAGSPASAEEKQGY